jgi:DNA-binding winged helix-turn-helix (wHTH) protein
MVTSTGNTFVFGRLVVEKGSPFEKGMCFALEHDKIILGRATSMFNPDIAFDSLLISRKHCCLKRQVEEFLISDLDSKHGTLLNGRPLQPHICYPLKSGDRIGLASGVILLRFSLSEEYDKTIDFENTHSIRHTNPLSALPLTIDLAKKDLRINDLEISLSIKEWCLLELLYKHKNELVSYETIRAVVWAERCTLDNGMPDVGFDEINVLLHRLRRKLGVYDKVLKTRRGQGCILEI